LAYRIENDDARAKDDLEDAHPKDRQTRGARADPCNRRRRTSWSRVQPSRILDKDGRQVLFQGVNRSGAEYACVQGGVCSPDRPPLARWARSPGGASSRARAPA
jgi:hypothetical protein